MHLIIEIVGIGVSYTLPKPVYIMTVLVYNGSVLRDPNDVSQIHVANTVIAVR